MSVVLIIYNWCIRLNDLLTISEDLLNSYKLYIYKGCLIRKESQHFIHCEIYFIGELLISLCILNGKTDTVGLKTGE